MDNFYPYIFLVAFLIGFVVRCSLFTLEPMLKLPNHNDAGDTLYIDDNGVCYRYKKEYIDCK